MKKFKLFTILAPFCLLACNNPQFIKTENSLRNSSRCMMGGNQVYWEYANGIEMNLAKKTPGVLLIVESSGALGSQFKIDNRLRLVLKMPQGNEIILNFEPDYNYVEPSTDSTVDFAFKQPMGIVHYYLTDMQFKALTQAISVYYILETTGDDKKGILKPENLNAFKEFEQKCYK